MKYLGIDFGSKRVGIAISDDAGAMGFPHAIMPNNGRLMCYVQQLITQKKIERVVIGESLNFAGKPNPIRDRSQTFARELTQLTGIDVVWEPEAFTTQEARRSPEGVWSNNGENVDASAAALILTSYLSRGKDSSSENSNDVREPLSSEPETAL